MIVVCNMEPCTYRSKNRFCTKKILGITQSGFCSHIFDEHGFEINFYRTVFYGICKGCKENQAEETL